MKAKLYSLMILFLVSTSTSLVCQVGQDHEMLFEKAVYTMETQADLKVAIALFDSLIQTYPKEIEYAAKAQFHIGLCYEKLGFIEAKKAFEKVINNYPTEVEIVSLAKEKLSEISAGPKKEETVTTDFQLQQVWAEPYDNSGMPSPDGRYLSYVNWGVPCLAIYELETGKSKNITSTTGSWGYVSIWPENSIWSPDGKKLAYVWYGEDRVSIRIVGIESSEPEVIFTCEDTEFSQPYSWSSDGKFILTVLCHGNRGHEIVLVSVEDYSVESLKKLEGRSHPWCSLSPDDKTVAYSFTSDLNSPQTDIYLLNIEDGTETVLVDHPETDFCPIWMPDGKNIIFFSDRTGMVSVWSQKISDGKADGEERLIKNLNRLDPMAITQKGELFMTLFEGGNDIYDAVIDPETGKIISGPKRIVESNVGWNLWAGFSPDGKRMAYVSQRGVLNPSLSWGQQSLIIRDLQTGTDRELIPRLKQIVGGPVNPPNWSPEGDEIVITGRDEVGHVGAFIVNVDDGSYTSLFEDQPFIGGSALWSENNTKLYYRIHSIPDKNGLYLIDRNSKTQSRMFGGESILEMSLNPKGNLMAFTTVNGNGIKLYNLENNELKEFVNLEPEVRYTTMAWSPDGRWMYFVKSFREDEVELWRISQDGKNIQLINDSFPHVKFLSIHPDGRRLVFTAGKMSGNYSLWVMKNFIPR